MQLDSVSLLKTLIGFDTTSKNSNLAFIDYVKSLLESHGIAVTVNVNSEENKANLLATVGPLDKRGVLLSGHSDVVPANPADWQTDPFIADERDGKIYGRGATDMKGFVACAIHSLCQAAELNRQQALQTPLHLCLSFDEEVGCLGVRHLLTDLPRLIQPPRFCLIGEPTAMQIAVGHKGKAVYQACCHGENGHSSTAPNYRNAIHVAAEFVSGLVASQKQLAESGQRDNDYDILYSTIHVGQIRGGTALNIVPERCLVDYEIRHIAEDSIASINQLINDSVQQQMYAEHVSIESKNAYPGLNTSRDNPELAFLRSLLAEDTSVGKISFGTEGGLFSQTFDSPVFVCGPGSMEQGHKPNEFIEISQLQRCDDFLQQLLAQLR